MNIKSRKSKIERVNVESGVIMNLSIEDERLLKELCEQNNVSFDKVVKLLMTVREHEFKERRTGIYEALRDIIKSDFSK